MARKELASHDIAATHDHRECFGSINSPLIYLLRVQGDLKRA